MADCSRSRKKGTAGLRATATLTASCHSAHLLLTLPPPGCVGFYACASGAIRREQSQGHPCRDAHDRRVRLRESAVTQLRDVLIRCSPNRRFARCVQASRGSLSYGRLLVQRQFLDELLRQIRVLQQRQQDLRVTVGAEVRHHRARRQGIARWWRGCKRSMSQRSRTTGWALAPRQIRQVPPLHHRSQ